MSFWGFLHYLTVGRAVRCLGRMCAYIGKVGMPEKFQKSNLKMMIWIYVFILHHWYQIVNY